MEAGHHSTMNNTMKQRLFLLLFAAFQLFATNARADEGMKLIFMCTRCAYRWVQ